MQTVVLKEAQRCIAPRVPRLRPFQKRALLMSMVYSILGEIDFMTPREKEAVLWKTQTSQEQLDPVTAWKRCKIIARDLDKLIRLMPRYMAPGRPHHVSVDMLVQALFVSLQRCFPTLFSGLSVTKADDILVPCIFVVLPLLMAHTERSP